MTRWRTSVIVRPDVQEVVKMWPANPPRVGEGILVDGVRHVVTKAKIQWEGRRWTIVKLRARPAPPAVTHTGENG